MPILQKNQNFSVPNQDAELLIGTNSNSTNQIQNLSNRNLSTTLVILHIISDYHETQICSNCKEMIDDFYISTCDINCKLKLFKKLSIKSNKYENIRDFLYY